MCAFALDRGEPDFWFGAYVVNMVVAEGLAALVGLVVLWRFWPESTPALAAGITSAAVLPVAFFPFSRTIWLAWDLCFRPAEPGD